MSELGYQKYLEGLRRQNASRAYSSLLDAPDPEVASRAFEVERELGVPSGQALFEMEKYDEDLEMKRSLDLLQDAPATANWLTNTMNAALAKRDLDKLTWMERFSRSQADAWVDMGARIGEGATAVGDANRFLMEQTPLGNDPMWRLGGGMIELVEGAGRGLAGGTVGMAEMATTTGPAVFAAGQTRQSLDVLRMFEAIQTLDPNMPRYEMAERMGIDPMSAEASIVYTYLRGTPEERQRLTDRVMQRLTSSQDVMAGFMQSMKQYAEIQQEIRGDTPFVWDIDSLRDFHMWLGYNAGQAIPWFVVMALAGTVAGPGGVAATGYLTGVADTQGTLMEAGITDRPDIALTAAVPYAALEYLGPVARIFRNSGASNVAAQTAARSFARRLLSEAPKSSFEEAINEFGQEAIMKIAADVAAETGIEFSRQDWLELLEAAAAGAVGGLTGSPMSAAGDVDADTGRISWESMRRMTSGATEQMLNQIDDVAVGMELKTLAPDRMQEVLTQQGMGDQNVYVLGDALREFFQTEGLPVTDEALLSYGIDPVQLEAAENSGGYVALPLSSYATYIAGTKGAQIIKEASTRNPGVEMSRRELRDTMQMLQEQQDAPAPVMEEGQDPTWLQAAQRVREVYEEGLTNVRGMEPARARIEASTLANAFLTWGQRTGQSPLQMLERFRVQMRGPLDEVSDTYTEGRDMEQARQLLDTPEFRTWFGESKVVDDTGAPLVVYHSTTAREDFGEFRPLSHFGTNGAAEDRLAGTWDFDEEGEAVAEYDDNARMIPAYLSLKNPVDVGVEGVDGGTWGGNDDVFLQVAETLRNSNPEVAQQVQDLFDAGAPDMDIVEVLERAGYDGVMYRNRVEDRGSISYVAFRPEQIKSVFNRGSFDGSDPRILYQSAALRGGAEDLSAYGIEPGKTYKTREIAAALEARTRDKHGTIAPDDRSSEAMSKIADWMVEEVLFEVEQSAAHGNSAVGWYSVKFQAALDKFAELFPELRMGANDMQGTVFASPQEARDYMTALVAITSDGEKVYTNWKRAAELYREARMTGVIPEDTQATRGVSMRVNARIINQLYAEHGAGMRDFLLEEFTASEINSEIKEMNKGRPEAEQLGLAQYPARRTLPRSAVYFGPKLGAFYANLSGAEGYLTMDRWWSRTFNRYRGILLDAPTPSAMRSLRVMILAERAGLPPIRPGLKGKARNEALARLEAQIDPAAIEALSDDQVLSAATGIAATYAAQNYKGGTAIQQTANTVYKAAFENTNDQPGSVSDRGFMIDSVALAQQRLAERGFDTSIADIQAILWYYEKRLYAEMGARATPDVSYEDVAQRIVEETLSDGRRDAEGLGEDLVQGPDGTWFPVGQGQGFGEETASVPAPADAGSGGGDQAATARTAGSVGTEAAQLPAAADGVALDPVTGADLGRLDAGDPAAVADFLRRPGWAVISATQDWGDNEFGPMHNARAADALRAELTQKGVPFIEQRGWYKGEDDGVTFLAVMDRDTAIRLGKQYEQESILTNEGWVYAKAPRPTTPTTGEVFLGGEAQRQDGMSVTQSGLQWSLGMDFSRGPGKPVFREGYSEAPGRPQLPVNANGKVELHHWSPATFTEADPAFAGTNPKVAGFERSRGLKAVFYGINPKATQRDPGTGYVRESFLQDGNHYVTEVDPQQLYPWYTDPDGIAAGKDEAAAEAAIREAGYLGYYVEDKGDPAGLSAPLGNVAVVFEKLPVKPAMKTYFQQGWQGEQASAAFTQNQRGDGDPFAKISLPAAGVDKGVTLIELFTLDNLTSFQHEVGHYLLEVFTVLAQEDGAPQQMVDDLATIREYLGWQEGQTEITTAQHELWARSWERYLMEGKAPSIELRDIFSRFKQWFLKQYKDVRALNAPITPEIREVMDRMLATDQQIEMAKAEAGQIALFDAPAPAGMSEDEWQRYMRIQSRARSAAEATLLEKVMAKIRARKEREYKQREREVRAEVEEELGRTRVYNLIRTLTARDTESKARPDKRELQEIMGEQDTDLLDDLSNRRHGTQKNLYTDNGAPPEIVATMYGYENVFQMVNDMRGARPFKEVVEEQTRKRMDMEVGDPFTDGSIEAEALEAVHNDARAEQMVFELRKVAEAQGKDRRPIRNQFFKAQARELFGKMSPAMWTVDGFLSSERRAMNRARAALSKGTEKGLAEAYKAQQEALLNHHLYMLARDATKKLESKRRKMERYKKESIRKQIAQEERDQIDALLEQYEFRKASQKMVDARISLKAYVDQMNAIGLGGRLNIDERLMQDARRRHYTRVPWDELLGLFSAVENLDYVGRTKTDLIEQERKRNLDEVAKGYGEAMRKNVKGKPPSRIETDGERRRRNVQDMLNSTMNADTLLRAADGFEDLGFVRSNMKDAIDDGMARVIERRQAEYARLHEIMSTYTQREKEQMARKRYIPALGGMFSKWDIIAIALNTGNEINYKRLTGENVVGSFAPNVVESVLGTELDERDGRFVQAIWDYLETFWPEIEAKEMRQTGTRPEKVQPKVMVMSLPGVTRGGYYPIKYDYRFGGKVGDREQMALTEQLMLGSFGKAQTRNGHTKARVDTVKEPLRLDIGIVFSHVNDVIYDLELGEAVNAAWSILHHKDVKDAYAELGRLSDFEALEMWLQDTAAGERIAARGIEKAMRFLRSGFVTTRLAANLVTVAIQPTGIVTSMAQVGKRAILKGMMMYMSNPVRWSKKVLDASSTMRQRKNTFERDLFNIVGEVQTKAVQGRYEQLLQNYGYPAYFWMMTNVQFYSVDMPTWVGAYQKEIERSGDEAKARRYADQMVERAQGSGLVQNRGALERGTWAPDARQREGAKLLTALGSYMFAKGNVAYERTMRTNFRHPGEAISWAADMMLMFSLEAIAYAMVTGFGPEDDEELWWWLTKETVFSMMSTLPIFREMAGAAQGFGGGGILGSAIETIIAKPLEQSEQWAGQPEGDWTLDKAHVKSLLDAAGIYLHLPTRQMNRVIDAFFEDDMSLREEIDAQKAIGIGVSDNTALLQRFIGETQ